MRTTIIKIRSKQFQRYLQELGIVRIIIIAFLLVSAITQIIKLLQKQNFGFVVLALFAVALITLHFKRKDTDFLRLVNRKTIVVYQIEYLFLALPLSLLFLFSAHLAFVIFPFLIALGIAVLPKKTYSSSGATFSLPFISDASYEWKAGLRKQFIYILILYVLGFVFASEIWLPPLLIVLLSITFSSFYLVCESRLMLQVWNCTSTQFLRKKIGMLLRNYLLILTPLILYSLLVNSDYWYLLLYASVAGILICILAILLKYSMYEPNLDLEFNKTIIGIALVSFLVPYLGAASLLLLVRYYRKSTHNLKSYL